MFNEDFRFELEDESKNEKIDENAIFSGNFYIYQGGLYLGTLKVEEDRLGKNISYRITESYLSIEETVNFLNALTKRFKLNGNEEIRNNYIH